MSDWIKALKEWNKNKASWCVPKKGSADYNEVRAIMDRMQPMPKTRRQMMEEKKQREVKTAPKKRAVKKTPTPPTGPKPAKRGPKPKPPTGPKPASAKRGPKPPPVAEEHMEDLENFWEDVSGEWMVIDYGKSRDEAELRKFSQKILYDKIGLNKFWAKALVSYYLSDASINRRFPANQRKWWKLLRRLLKEFYQGYKTKEEKQIDKEYSEYLAEKQFKKAMQRK